MQYSMSFPFNYTYLDRSRKLWGCSDYLSIDISSDPYLNLDAIKDMVNKLISDRWKALWIDPRSMVEGKDKWECEGFDLEPLDLKVWYHNAMEDQIQADLAEAGLECTVDILPLDPNEKKLFGIDFICPTINGLGGCLLVETPVPMPSNLISSISDLKGKWILHKGIVQEDGNNLWIKDRKFNIRLDRDRALLGTTPYQALASNLLERTQMEKAKFRFLEGTRIVFNKDTV